VQEIAASCNEPAEHELSGNAFLVDLGVQVQVFFLAFQANSNILLVDAIVLKKGQLVEHFAHVLHPESIDDVMEAIFF